jgi:hypothetical protein
MTNRIIGVAPKVGHGSPIAKGEVVPFGFPEVREGW